MLKNIYFWYRCYSKTKQRNHFLLTQIHFNMKKNLFFIAALFVASSVSAQFYAGLSAGYQVGSAKQNEGSKIDMTNTTYTESSLMGSYGNGMNLNLKLGYNITENLGFELGANYLLGFAQSNGEATVDITNYKKTVLVESKSSGLRLMPQLTFRLENGLYSRAGIIVPVIGKTVTQYDETVTTPISTSKVHKTIESVGSFSIGYVGAIGYAYKLSDNLSVFGEIEYIGLFIKGKTQTVTEWTENDKDVLADKKVVEKETNFVDAIDYIKDNNEDQTFDENKPMNEFAGRSPFSSFGFNIGVMMSF